MDLLKKIVSGRLPPGEGLEEFTVAELAEAILGREEALSAESLILLENDSRAGVKALAKKAERIIKAEKEERRRLKKLCRWEALLRQRGINRIAGIDEAGVGPLAGPVVAAAVIFPPGRTIKKLDDSKKLSPGLRIELARQIQQEALCWAIGQASPEEIDELNIYQASLLAMRRAVFQLSLPPEHLLIDARKIPGLAIPQTSIIHGDSLSLSIAAASILAKTTRDRFMAEMDRQYPGYGFAANKGYPTREHRAALQMLGPSSIHRKSFSWS